MTNTMDFNGKSFKEITDAIAKDIYTSGADISTIDGMYDVVRKYGDISKEQFTEYYNQSMENLKEHQSEELSEDELEMVVGGNGFTDWFKQHGAAIGIIAVAALALTGVGAIGGVAIGAVTGSLLGATVGAGALTGAGCMAATVGIGAAIGAGFKIYDECKNNTVSKNGISGLVM